MQSNIIEVTLKEIQNQKLVFNFIADLISIQNLLNLKKA